MHSQCPHQLSLVYSCMLPHSSSYLITTGLGLVTSNRAAFSLTFVCFSSVFYASGMFDQRCQVRTGSLSYRYYESV